jgi:hypothetical protein
MNALLFKVQKKDIWLLIKYSHTTTKMGASKSNSDPRALKKTPILNLILLFYKEYNHDVILKLD